MRYVLVALLTLLGCGNPGAPANRSQPEVSATDEPGPVEPGPEGEDRAEEGPSCDDLRAEEQDALREVLVEHQACAFDHECVEAPVATRCTEGCGVAVHARGLRAVRAAVERLNGGVCATFGERGCALAQEECARSTPRCDGARCLMDEGDAPLRDVPVPEANRAGREPAPPRPSPGEAETERGRRLLEAIAADDPTLAQDFFFPREAFAKVKAIEDPDGYWHRLFARYAGDIHALHGELGDLSGAEFDRLDIIRRGGWVPRGDEGNALPYWVSRHSRLYYRVGDDARSFEVRVLITWGDRWYITHLSELH